MKIGLISDTHGWIHPRLFELFKDCDEIWHAGDIGDISVADRFAIYKPFKAVYGNIDGLPARVVYSESLFFRVGEVNVLMTHIGGSPGRYDHRAKTLFDENRPDLFICGHSHIAKVMYDKKEAFLYVNPGAAGYIGFHKLMTAVRFTITGKRIHDMELIELGERGKAFTC